MAKNDSGKGWEFGLGQPFKGEISKGQPRKGALSSEWISYRHWSGPAMMARRSQEGKGSTWDVIYDGSLFIGHGNIEYMTLDGSGWYASWYKNDFFHAKSDGTTSHFDKVIRYFSGENPAVPLEASWDARARRFNIVNLPMKKTASR